MQKVHFCRFTEGKAALEINGIISLNVFISLLYTKEKKRREAVRKSSSETDLEGFTQKEM